MAKTHDFVAASRTAHVDLRAAKEEWSKRLLQTQPRGLRDVAVAATAPDPGANVVGVGIGEKVVDRRLSGTLALKFLVRVKFPRNQIPTRDRLPTWVEGLPVDVEQVGLLRRFATKGTPAKRPGRGTTAAQMPDPRRRYRPAAPGCSVGFVQEGRASAGTLGAVVKGRGGTYVLSNNHVLADENRLRVGSPILQPGVLDGGAEPRDVVATLTRFVALQAGVYNTVDAAVARVKAANLVTPSILHIGKATGVAAAQIDMVVHKFGRTTGYTVGRVTSVETDVSVLYETGTFLFDNQIIIVGLGELPFSRAGDSGSLILDRTTREAVGLLFAGSSSHTVANHMQPVLQALNVRL